jgi:hypothetical protein
MTQVRSVSVIRASFVLVSTLGLLRMGFAAAQASAQTIRITEPVEWRDNRAAPINPGQPVRIAGFVTHPGGVQRVLVNGEEAMVQVDRDFPDSFQFERVLPAANLPREITIRVVPRTGQPFEAKYAFQFPQLAPPPNPWGGFRFRAIAYGAAVIAGAVLSTRTTSETAEVCEQQAAGLDCFNRTTTEPASKGVGLGLIGAGAAGLLIDALLTSGRAKDARSEQGFLQPLPRVRLSVLKPAYMGRTPRTELFRFQVR